MREKEEETRDEHQNEEGEEERDVKKEDEDQNTKVRKRQENLATLKITLMERKRNIV